jgi:hypothetical protein
MLPADPATAPATDPMRPAAGAARSTLGRKDEVNYPVRSGTRNGNLWPDHRDPSAGRGLLGGPRTVRLRGDAEDMHVVGADLDRKQAAQTLKCRSAVPHGRSPGRAWSLLGCAGTGSARRFGAGGSGAVCQLGRCGKLRAGQPGPAFRAVAVTAGACPRCPQAGCHHQSCLRPRGGGPPGGPVLRPAAPAGCQARTGAPGAAQGEGDDGRPAGLDR